jgi:hypothetical protein
VLYERVVSGVGEKVSVFPSFPGARGSGATVKSRLDPFSIELKRRAVIPPFQIPVPVEMSWAERCSSLPPTGVLGAAFEEISSFPSSFRDFV